MQPAGVAVRGLVHRLCCAVLRHCFAAGLWACGKLSHAGTTQIDRDTPISWPGRTCCSGRIVHCNQAVPLLHRAWHVPGYVQTLLLHLTCGVAACSTHTRL